MVCNSPLESSVPFGFGVGDALTKLQARSPEKPFVFSAFRLWRRGRLSVPTQLPGRHGAGSSVPFGFGVGDATIWSDFEPLDWAPCLQCLSALASGTPFGLGTLSLPPYSHSLQCLSALASGTPRPRIPFLQPQKEVFSAFRLWRRGRQIRGRLPPAFRCEASSVPFGFGVGDAQLPPSPTRGKMGGVFSAFRLWRRGRHSKIQSMLAPAESSLQCLSALASGTPFAGIVKEPLRRQGLQCLSALASGTPKKLWTNLWTKVSGLQCLSALASGTPWTNDFAAVSAARVSSVPFGFGVGDAHNGTDNGTANGGTESSVPFGFGVGDAF